jgi:hypothetical protein
MIRDDLKVMALWTLYALALWYVFRLMWRVWL